jgi:branched-chain amino acid transport system substrate-binding protein
MTPFVAPKIASQRRVLLRTCAAAAIGGSAFWPLQPLFAQARAKRPLLIGLATDDTGVYGASGQDERRGMHMAIAEANAKGGVLGRQLETTHADTGGNPEQAARVAEQMIQRQEVAFLLGAVHSGVASAMSKVAQKQGCIYFNTNSSSPTEAGQDCHRTKFVWDANGTNFAIAVVKAAMTGFGQEWALITSDYGWGRSTAKGLRSLVEGKGGRIIEELVVPQNTRDFAAVLDKIREINPRVVATAVGGDDLKALRQQVRQARLDRGVGWINSQQDWPEVYGQSGDQAAFGIFGTTWYWGLGLSGVDAFCKRYAAANPGYRIKTPGNVFYNGYMAMRELLRAIERTGTTNNLKLIGELEKLRIPALDRMQHHDAYMNPSTHHLQQTTYIASYNSAPRTPDDLFRVLARLRPEDVLDPASVSSCKLESLAATPSYEP